MYSTFRVLAAAALLLGGASTVNAKTDALLTPTGPGGVGSVECLRVQLAAQAAVLAGMPYANHGALVSTAAHVVSSAEDRGSIDSECASCIISQFARRVPIENQEACGEETRVVEDLRGPEVPGACDGPVVGSTSIQEFVSGDIELRLVFTSGPANALLNVYWVGTSTANGCHNDGLGFVDLGTVTTDAAGIGNFVATLVGGNPFPGDYVHIDACAPPCTGPTFTSLYGDVFSVVRRPEIKAASGGDPTTLAAKPEDARPWSRVKGLYR